MNRREALLTMAGTLAAFVLPAPRLRVNLRQFCARLPGVKYDCTMPYSFNDFVYATDQHVCLRVRPALADRVHHEGPVPPFDALSWNHDRLRGWRSLPKLEPLLAKDSSCDRCDGCWYTHDGDPAMCSECATCDGMGRTWEGNGWDLSVPVQCVSCLCGGLVPPPNAIKCPDCDGKAIGVFPSVVRLDGVYFDRVLYERVRGAGGEFVHDNWHAMSSYPLMKFRLDGEGDGLLMGMDRIGVESRLVKAGA